ncbi:MULTISPECIES: FkbM family methyltransferase [Bizionia]|uniref:FkbM family methyltransferase n=1 Tax=Bizionia algoritergicola TaxID=291187 RepID=A0A5D0QTV2_9FLAO|nr:MULTISPECIES: FkbM family methyltransferase [Bizionia]OBX23241.1 hypothetical protein BAA08_05460 [Bizionia sp. APA-3]TYB71614.1 FkbM family methyltransferase [Bizionia algoritergicola]
MKSFQDALAQKIIDSLPNNYGIENFDTYRFGAFLKDSESIKKPKTLKSRFKILIKNLIGYHPEHNVYISKGQKLIGEYLNEFELYWSQLTKTDGELLISLLAYRVLGYTKVKLPRNNKDYWESIDKAKQLADFDDALNPNFMHFMLYKFNLESVGYPISLYFSESRVAVDFLIEQYAYKIDGQEIIAATEGDTVLDLGGCWGDTALYFAKKVGASGHVYSFEFIPENIKIFNKNVSLNNNYEKRITLVNNPVSEYSNDTIFFKDNGPASRVEFNSFPEQTGTTQTISIDDFVVNQKLHTVNFIKMDIEGAELPALKGAIQTIKKYRPKLAIAIYHSIHDLAVIPAWILDLNLDYDIFIGHYTIHAEETICFAIPKKNN